MIALRKNPIFKVLRHACPEWDWSKEKGWFYWRFALLGTHYLYAFENVPIKSLLDMTLVAVEMFREPERKLYFFHDGHSGWISYPRKIRGFQIESLGEIELLVSKHIYFRNPFHYDDNYNIIDTGGQWMITFGHENDWRVFHCEQREVERLKASIDASGHSGVYEGSTENLGRKNNGSGEVSGHRDKGA